MISYVSVGHNVKRLTSGHSGDSASVIRISALQGHDGQWEMLKTSYEAVIDSWSQFCK